MTVNRVWCSGPITNADFLCHAVRSTRGDRTLRLEYSLQTRSRFLPSGHLLSLLPRDAYVLSELFILCIVFFCRTHSTHGCSMLIECGFKSYLTMQLPSTSWSCNTSQLTRMGYVYLFPAEQTLIHTLLSCSQLPPSLQDARRQASGLTMKTDVTRRTGCIVQQTHWVCLDVRVCMQQNLYASVILIH